MKTSRFAAFVRRHPVRFWVITGLLFVVIFAGYTASRVVSMGFSLQSVADLTEQIGEHASDGDVQALAADLRLVQKHTADAANTSGEWTVVLASGQPFYGREIAALRVVSTSASDLSRAASPLVELLPRLASDDISGTGGFDLALVENLETAVGSLSTAVHASSGKLAPLAKEPLAAPLHDRLVTLTSALDAAGPGLERVTPFVEALPVILGANGKRTWFVTMQNLTESRPSGGLLSAYIILGADEGKLDMITQGSNDTLENGPTVPDGAMPPGLKSLWGDYLNSWLSMNLSADFPTNAQLISDGWNIRGEQQVDGVISLGQGTVQYLAAAVGPVTVRGITIQPADMVQYLSVDLYKQFPDPTEKDVVLAEIIAQIFEKLSSGEFNVQSLVSQAITSQNADYLQLWSADKVEQSQLENAGLSGALSEDYGPNSSVRLINAAGNKLDAFLELSADYRLGACVVDEEANSRTRTGTVTVTVTNNAPTSGLPPYMTGRVELQELGLDYVVGSNHTYVEVYLPRDAVPDTFSYDGADAFLSSGIERNHEFYLFDVELDPGESAQLVATWTEPAEDDGENALPSTPTLTMQPLLNTPTVTTSGVGGSC